MTASLTAGTRVLALLGNPVDHSLSPRFQNAAIAAAGLDGVYVALRCEADDVDGLIRGLARAGGGGNVTVPHKEVAARAVERPSDAVLATGACNTFWLEDDRVHGDNTDVEGFETALGSLLRGSPGGARVVLIGAGGAARSAAYALVGAGAEEIVVVNRTTAAARELAARFGAAKTRFEVRERLSLLEGESFDLAVNATALGLRSGDPLPLPADGSVRIGAAFDLVYRAEATEWIRANAARGIPSADGLEMLLRQGAAAFTRWWRVPPPLDAMRAALPAR